MIFARVGETGLGGEDFDLDQGVRLSHWIHEYDETYSLCGLIYRAEGENSEIRFFCQLYLDGCWWSYDGGVDDGRLSYLGEFDHVHCDDDATEYLLMFVRTESVTATYGGKAVKYLTDEPKVSYQTTPGRMRRKRCTL